VGSEDRIEKIVAETLAELDSRASEAGNGYPFALDSGAVFLRDSAWAEQTSYLFCLAAATLADDEKVNVTCETARLFEELSTEVASRYIVGKAIRFGFPRRAAVISASFKQAVEELATLHLREGGGISGRWAAWNKDYGVDVVAWRDAGGERPGRLILFGACAAGGNWRKKIGELDADEWSKEYLIDPIPRASLLQALFFTHRLGAENDWRKAYRRGIPFDRCRVARWAPELPRLQDHGSGRRWTRAALRVIAGRQ
jgi:hypothetical protein